MLWLFGRRELLDLIDLQAGAALVAQIALFEATKSTILYSPIRNDTLIFYYNNIIATASQYYQYYRLLTSTFDLYQLARKHQLFVVLVILHQILFHYKYLIGLLGLQYLEYYLYSFYYIKLHLFVYTEADVSRSHHRSIIISAVSIFAEPYLLLTTRLSELKRVSTRAKIYTTKDIPTLYHHHRINGTTHLISLLNNAAPSLYLKDSINLALSIS